MMLIGTVFVLFLLSYVDGEIALCVVPATVHVRQNDTCNSMSAITRDAVNWAGMRGEQEAIQIMIEGIPSTANMTSYLSIEFSDLTEQFGVGQINKDALKWWQVGYVNCKVTTRYPGSGGGWRPDPLLTPSINNNITLESNVTQPVWVTIHIPPSTIAGDYVGRITVIIQGSGATMSTTIPVYLVVWDILLPELKTANFSSVFSFDTSALYDYYKDADDMKFHYFDMLVDQRVANTDLYHGVPSLDEDYDFLFKAGVQYMGIVDVDAVLHSVTGEKQLRGVCHNFTDDEVTKIINHLEPYIVKYNNLGYLDNMFVYGFDEVGEECVESITKMFGQVKSKWPGLSTMAAINFIPPITLPVDIWVLQYEFYDKEKTAPWINSGKKQWWYHCIEPSKDTYLNSFIERPLMEIRLLYWLASGEPIGGWLYYAIDLWKRVPFNNATLQRLENTARTNFDPANYIWYPDTSIFANGDGYFIYPGPDGPIPTIRLHNFRDGFEDIELLRMLDLNNTRQLVQALVRSPTDYTLDPYLLEETRRKAAELVMKKLQ